MKKIYISPQTACIQVASVLPLAASKLDSSQDDQSVTPTDEEYNGEFSSRRRRDLWADEEEDF